MSTSQCGRYDDSVFLQIYMNREKDEILRDSISAHTLFVIAGLLDLFITRFPYSAYIYNWKYLQGNIIYIIYYKLHPELYRQILYTTQIMSEVPSQYNSQTVIDAANTKLQEEGINAAQTVFQSALLDWVDDVTMGDHENIIEDGVKGEIAKLWLAYADLNRQANMVSLNIEVKI